MLNNFFLLTCLVFCLSFQTVQAESLFGDSIQQNNEKVSTKSLRVHKKRSASVRMNLLTKNTERFELNLFPGEEFVAKRSAFKLKKGGNKVWRGNLIKEHTAKTGVVIEEKVGSVVFIIRGLYAHGTIHYRGDTYSVKPLRNGDHEIIKVNTTEYPKEHPEIQPKSQPLTGSPSRDEGLLVDVSLSTTGSSLSATEFQAFDLVAPLAGISNVRVMVAYTPLVNQQVVDIEGDIALAVAGINASYSNSGIDDTLSIELVHTFELNYIESGDIIADAESFRTEVKVHDLREQYMADIVVLVVGNSAYCGYASALDAEDTNAFAVVDEVCLVGNYSLAHEIGHLQGARHNTEVDATATPFTYGHGYLDSVNQFRTIMAYDCPEGGCTRVPYWSDPNIFYTGYTTGSAAIEHNSRVLEETAVKTAGLWTTDIIPYNILNYSDFYFDRVNRAPAVGPEKNTPSTINDGTPTIPNWLGELTENPLLFHAVGEASPYKEGVGFNLDHGLDDEIDMIEVSFDLVTSNLIGEIGALFNLELQSSSQGLLQLSDDGNILFNGLSIGSFVNLDLLKINVNINFVADTLTILVNDVELHSQSWTANALTAVNMGIEGGVNHQVAVDNILIASNGISFADISADFDLVSLGAWVDGDIAYTAQFINDGPNIATNVEGVITIPAELTLTSFDAPGASCNFVAPELTCTNVELGAHDSIDVSVVASTANSVDRFPFSLSGSSDTSASLDLDLNNNDLTMIFGGAGIQADLGVEMTGVEDEWDIIVDVTVTNHGPDDSDDVIFTLPTPPIYLAVKDISNSDCIHAKNNDDSFQLLCSIGGLATGEKFQTTITYTSRVSLVVMNFTGSINNAASDPNTENNSVTGNYGVSITNCGATPIGLLLSSSLLGFCRRKLKAAKKVV